MGILDELKILAEQVKEVKPDYNMLFILTNEEYNELNISQILELHNDNIYVINSSILPSSDTDERKVYLFKNTPMYMRVRYE